MSAVETVRDDMERRVPEPGEDREDLARRMFYLQMEIYSAQKTRVRSDGVHPSEG